MGPSWKHAKLTKNGLHRQTGDSWQNIAVRPSIGDPSDERHGSVYLYSNTGEELSSFDSHGGERGILFWPDDQHLLFGGYDLRSQKITVIQRSIHSGSLYLPLEHTALDGTSQCIIGRSNNGRYLAGWSTSPNSSTQLSETTGRLDRAI